MITNLIADALADDPASAAHDATTSTETRTLAPDRMTALLTRAVSEFDDAITQSVHDLFPGGPDALSTLTPEDIARVVLVDGATHPAISRCLTGTTVLIALLDPRRNFYVCSLGDCTAGTLAAGRV